MKITDYYTNKKRYLERQRVLIDKNENSFVTTMFMLAQPVRFKLSAVVWRPQR